MNVMSLRLASIAASSGVWPQHVLRIQLRAAVHRIAGAAGVAAINGIEQRVVRRHLGYALQRRRRRAGGNRARNGRRRCLGRIFLRGFGALGGFLGIGQRLGLLLLVGFSKCRRDDGHAKIKRG